MIWWCLEHDQCKKACDLEDDDGMYPPSLNHRFVEALLIVKDSPQIEIEVQSVHPLSIECYDLPLWQSIKSDWRYLLVPLGPVEREGEE